VSKKQVGNICSPAFSGTLIGIDESGESVRGVEKVFILKTVNYVLSNKVRNECQGQI